MRASGRDVLFLPTYVAQHVLRPHEEVCNSGILWWWGCALHDVKHLYCNITREQCRQRNLSSCSLNLCSQFSHHGFIIPWWLLLSKEIPVSAQLSLLCGLCAFQPHECLSSQSLNLLTLLWPITFTTHAVDLYSTASYLCILCKLLFVLLCIHS